MSNDDFEKGLNLLLNNAYNTPTPSEEFRSKLLGDLKSRQRIKASARRSRVITLYSSLSAVAAVVVFTFIPSIGLFADVESTSSAIKTAQVSQTVDKNIITTNNLVKQVSTPISNTTVTPQFASLETPSFNPTRAHAIESLDVFSPETKKWTSITAGSEFSLSSGTMVRTPLGAVQSVNFSIDNGPSVMLDGMSKITVRGDTLKLDDGRAVVSIEANHNPMKLQLDTQNINLQSGSMVFATLDNDSAYADSGIPAPMLVLLKGEATTSENPDNMLAEGRVYELFDTGTGRYPSRKVGSYENKREFMPMIDAIQATYKSYE